MRHRTSTNVKLAVRKETLRRLRSLSEDELRVAGGQYTGGPPTTSARPSNNGC